MIIITKKINYFSKLTLIVVCFLFIVGLAQSQATQINITLTWSTDTYVPAKYQGKALPIRGSNIEINANIDESEINPENLIYNWFINDYFQEESSGLNKQVLKFNTEITINNKNVIRLEIKNTNNIFLGIAYLSIEICEPEIILYVKNLPNKYEIKSNQEAQFVARPYFFNISNTNELNYKWKFDEQEALKIDENNPNTLILKINELTESIKKKLEVIAENKNNKNQKAQSIIEITLIP